MKKARKPKNLATARWDEKMSPEEKSAAARRMVERRWLNVTPEERSKQMQAIAAQGAGRPRSRKARCECGNFTLATARTRADVTGRGLGHEKGCSFYRAAPVRPREKQLEKA